MTNFQTFHCTSSFVSCFLCLWTEILQQLENDIISFEYNRNGNISKPIYGERIICQCETQATYRLQIRVIGVDFVCAAPSLPMSCLTCPACAHVCFSHYRPRAICSNIKTLPATRRFAIMQTRLEINQHENIELQYEQVQVCTRISLLQHDGYICIS